MDLNVKWKTRNLSATDIGENLWDLDLCKEFLYLTPKTQSIKGKTDKLNSNKLQNFCFAKNPIKKMKI